MVQTAPRLVLNITQNTTLKRRPLPLENLSCNEKVATSPQQVCLKSYQATDPNAPGHLQVTFEEPCHGSNTWYIEQQYGQVGQAIVQPTPKPATPTTPQPTRAENGNGSANGAKPTKINQAGLELIKKAEGLRLDAYICPAGVLTIGYGSTFNVKAGDRITAEEAEARLRKDVEIFEKAVCELVKVNLTSNQFSALVSFVYNIGPEAFRESTLLRKLNAGDYPGAADQFLVWNKGGGQVLEGLVIRRQAERQLFLTA